MGERTLSLVHTSTYSYLPPDRTNMLIRFEGSRTEQIWIDMLRRNGLYTENDCTPADLFSFVKTAFENKYHCQLPVVFHNDFIARENTPVGFTEATKIYSTPNLIYLDVNIVSALYEYLVCYYLWSVSEGELDDFCYPFTVSIMDYCIRLGLVDSDEMKYQLVSRMNQCLSDAGICVIDSLFWSALTFSIAHELAHIAMNHFDGQQSCEAEYEADAMAADFYFSLIDGSIQTEPSPFLSSYHDYLYGAPVILLQFFEDFYYFQNHLFGEMAGTSHPPISERTDRILEQATEARYAFDSEDGNVILGGYADSSTKFRQFLPISQITGKLHGMKMEGLTNMTEVKNDALLYNDMMLEKVAELGVPYGIPGEKMKGFWDTLTDIMITDQSNETPFVWSAKGKTYSTKLFNIQFNPGKLFMDFVVNEIPTQWIAAHSPNDPLSASIWLGMRILFLIVDWMTIELKEEHVQVLKRCYELGALSTVVQEDQILDGLEATETTIAELVSLGCLQRYASGITMNERINIR